MLCKLHAIRGKILQQLGGVQRLNTIGISELECGIYMLYIETDLVVWCGSVVSFKSNNKK